MKSQNLLLFHPLTKVFIYFKNNKKFIFSQFIVKQSKDFQNKNYLLENFGSSLNYDSWFLSITSRLPTAKQLERLYVILDQLIISNFNTTQYIKQILIMSDRRLFDQRLGREVIEKDFCFILVLIQNYENVIC